MTYARSVCCRSPRPSRIDLVSAIAAVITAVLAAVAWLRVRGVRRKGAPGMYDLVVIMLVSLAAATTMGDAAF